MKTKKVILVTGIAVGGFLTLSPLWGLIGTVLGMVRSFQAIGSRAMPVDMTSLSEGIRTSLLSGAIGLVLFPFGIVLLVTSIVLYVRLRRSLPPRLPHASAETKFQA